MQWLVFLLLKILGTSTVVQMSGETAIPYNGGTKCDLPQFGSLHQVPEEIAPGIFYGHCFLKDLDLQANRVEEKEKMPLKASIMKKILAVS